MPVLGRMLLVGAAAVPLIPALAWLSVRHRGLGLPLYALDRGIDVWQVQLVWALALGGVAFFVAQTDRLLGAAVSWFGLLMAWRGARPDPTWVAMGAPDPTHTLFFAAGAAALVLARRISHAAPIFGGLGLFLAVLMLGQKLAGLEPLGTLGSVNSSAIFVACMAPLLSGPALLVAMGAVLASKSLTASVALGAALVWRFRASWVSVVALWATFVGVVLAQGKIPQSAGLRGLVVWQALSDWWTSAPLLGTGLGAVRSAPLSFQWLGGNGGNVTQGWQVLDNEWAQWTVETGLLGVGLLGLWLWSHRARFQHPVYGPSLIALGVSALGWFTFHVPALALPGLVLLGVAEPEGVTDA